MNSVYCNRIDPNHIVQSRKELPEAYHCGCEYCQNFLGEIFHNDSEKYYSNHIRKGYYGKPSEKHLDVGHSIGYKWAIQNFSKEGDWVFDPTVGSGTTIVESIVEGRNAVGIELEFPEVAKENIGEQYRSKRVKEGVSHFLFEGNATDTKNVLGDLDDQIYFDLIINGTPYPRSGILSRDAPERKKIGENTRIDNTFNYSHPENIGLTKGNSYRDLLEKIYSQSVDRLKPGGFMVIIIKDPMEKRKPLNLHGYICDIILETSPKMRRFGFFIHRHIPETFFMRTYRKRMGFEPVLYQTGIVLRKEDV